MRVCLEPDCPCLTDSRTARCSQHRRKRERDRGTRQARGYGVSHDHLRASYQQRMDAGETFTCWRCLETITPTHWHLGHDDHDRSKYRGPECVSCNTATASADRRISPGA